ncbi:c-type cytochrome [Oxalobacteraceae bacterium A2-2]
MNHSALRATALGLALAATQAHAAPALSAAQLYQNHCAVCHGASLEGGTGPTLGQHAWIHGAPTKANLVKVISKGVPDKGMPAWSPALSAEQIAVLADYVGERATKPAVAAARATATTAAAGAKPSSFDLGGFKLPKGFRISLYAEGAATARALAVSDSGVVYVGSRKAGKVYALVPRADRQSAEVVTVAEGLDSPIGVTLLNGALYVGEISRVIRFDDIDRSYASKPAYKVVSTALPKDKWHGEKVIKAGPDGKLYVPVGAPCNVCDTETTQSARIWRMNPDGSQLEEYARGIRNTVGFSFHPVTKALWFTDNGRDEMGDNTPSCELNVAPRPGLHFGFPYCHGGVVPDPDYAKGKSCAQFEAPMAKLGPHVAPLGLAFYTGQQFPASYRNSIFVAEHGSWNRSTKSGYQVRLITLYDSKVVSDTPFVEGFLRGKDDEVVARPVDVAQLPDGSLLISDDFGGRIFRVSYEGK